MATTAIARKASRADLKRPQYQVGSGVRAGLWNFFVRLMDFGLQRIQNTAVTATLDVILEPLQSHADHVAVVEPRPDARLRAQAQPDVMQAVDVLRP